jgi:iron complex outermembrane receptor protein
MRRKTAALLAIMAPLAVPLANAQETRVFQIPRGTLASSIAALSSQANISISVAQNHLWQLPVQPVHGRMTAERALAIMLQGSGASAVQVSATSWRIEALRTPRKPQPAPRSHRASPVQHSTAAPADVIIVTATKASLPANIYAGTATLISGEDLNFGGERGTDSILRHTATLSSTHLGSGRNKLFIRGIADSSFTGPTQSTVGQYLGDIRLSYNAPDPDLRLYDLDGVEVLEGPQGTLYGAGSLGGIIRMVPRAPHADHAELQAIAGLSLTQNGQPGGDIAAIANIPLSQQGGGHALRLVGYMVSDGGYIDNPLLGQDDVNRTQIRGARGTLRLSPSENFTVDIGGIYQHNISDDAQYIDREADRLTRLSSVIQAADARYGMASLVLTYDFGDLTLQSSNAAIDHKLSERFDSSPNLDNPRAVDQENDTRLWVSETRLSRPFAGGLGWVVGVSYIDNKSAQLRETDIGILRAPLTGVSNHVQEWTAYANAAINLAPNLTATGGLRYSETSLDGAGENVPESIALVSANRAITANRKETDFLPSASILFAPSDHLRLYLSYAQGFRPGGLAISSQFVRRFRHDRVKTWEAGVRYARHDDAPFDVNLSLSHSDWRDIQADFIDESGFPTTANIGNGRITSLSGSLTYRLTPLLTLELGGVYNHSRVDAEMLAQQGFIFLTPQHLRHIPNVARTTLRGAITYAQNLGRNDLRVNGWAHYVGPSRLGIGPVLGEKQGNYLDSGLAARLGNAARGLTLTLSNPLNVRGNRFALGTPFREDGDNFITPLRPRSLRIAADFRY